MRVGFFATLFLSAFAVQAAPSSPQQQGRDLVDNINTAVDQAFSVTVDFKSILSEATPIVESVFEEATSVAGQFLASDTALASEGMSHCLMNEYTWAILMHQPFVVTGILSDVGSALKPAESIANDVKNVIVSNGATSTPDAAATRQLAMGVVAALGSMFLGAFVVL